MSKKVVAKKPVAKKAAAKKPAPKKIPAKKAPAKKAATPRAEKKIAANLNRPLYNENPWSTRRPQSLVLTAVVLVVLVGVVVAAFDYLSQSRGGVVPPLMLAVAPLLAIYYVWYFNFSQKR